MKRKLLALLLALSVMLTLVPTAALAVEGDVTEPCTVTEGYTLGAGHKGDCVTTPADPVEPTDGNENNNGETGDAEPTAEETLAEMIAALPTPEEPTTLTSIGGELSSGTYTVSDTLTLTQQVTISGDVTISGNGTIKRGDNLTTYMIVVPEGSSLTLNDITIDGGAVWSEDNDTTLERGITNSGVSAKAAMVYNFGTLNIEGETVLQNNSNESQRVSESGVPIFSATDDGQGAVAYPTSGEETSYGGAVLNGGSMTISGGTIQNNQAFRGAGVCSYGVLTMTDGTITRNHTVAMETAQYADGAGIYQEGGRNGTEADLTETAYCEISGGSITENVADGNAAGILTENYGKLYLSGSVSITKNICGRVFENAAGGGVSLYRAYGEIDGGEISENTSASEQANGGGIHLSTSSILKMTGGTVSKNKAADSGGGINIAGGSTVELGSGVKITNNSAKYGGGIYAAGSSTAPTLTISGAEISENTATASGAGVYVSADSVVMKDGSIKENSITSKGDSAANIFGGGVYINNTESTFVMQGGSIGKNSLTLDNGTTSNLYAYGAGVYADDRPGPL